MNKSIATHALIATACQIHRPKLREGSRIDYPNVYCCCFIVSLQYRWHRGRGPRTPHRLANSPREEALQMHIVSLTHHIPAPSLPPPLNVQIYCFRALPSRTTRWTGSYSYMSAFVHCNLMPPPPPTPSIMLLCTFLEYYVFVKSSPSSGSSQTTARRVERRCLCPQRHKLKTFAIFRVKIKSINSRVVFPREQRKNAFRRKVK